MKSKMYSVMVVFSSLEDIPYKPAKIGVFFLLLFCKGSCLSTLSFYLFLLEHILVNFPYLENPYPPRNQIYYTLISKC